VPRQVFGEKQEINKTYPQMVDRIDQCVDKLVDYLLKLKNKVN